MRIEYECHGSKGMRPQKWKGEVKVLNHHAPYEMEISARGSYFHLIVGKHAYGNYMCLPNWNIGSEMASMSDSFWNWERLKEAGMKSVDAYSIADALVALSEYMEL
ncbi:MAG: hypothetical protein PUC65_06285 [Clostridiales bacterium]|nr:hypothetical protein [Clostridiales bacterium]